MKSWLTETHARINGDKFLICYLMLLATPFWFCLLPLLILSAPMRLMWAKERGRLWWRVGSSLWLVASVLLACKLAHAASTLPDGTVFHGFPLRIPLDPMMGDDPMAAAWLKGINLSLVAGTLMLPLSAASWMETKLRLRRG